MCEDFQSHLAALAPGISAADEGVEPTLEHGEYRFDLNAIAIGCEVEPRLHQPPITTSGRILRGLAARCRNQGPDAALLAGKAMIGFGVVAGIGSDARQAYTRECFDQERLEFRDIDIGSTPGLVSENEMRLDVADHTELGVMMINHRFPGSSHRSAPPHEVAACRTRLQSGGVNSRATNSPFAPQVLANGGVQEASGRRCRQQSPRRFLERRVVRNTGQPQRLDERRTIGQMSNHTPIVRLQKALQHQTGKELMLRKLLGATAM